MKHLEFEIGGKKYQGLGQKVGDSIWVHFEGRTHSFSPEKKTVKKAKTSEGSGEILAPMPGKVTKISVNKGDEVITGQTVAVMEAMKMEYNLKAPAAGRVKEILCEAGAQVSMGQRLLFIDLEKATE